MKDLWLMMVYKRIVLLERSASIKHLPPGKSATGGEIAGRGGVVMNTKRYWLCVALRIFLCSLCGKF